MRKSDITRFRSSLSSSGEEREAALPYILVKILSSSLSMSREYNAYSLAWWMPYRLKSLRSQVGSFLGVWFNQWGIWSA